MSRTLPRLAKSLVIHSREYLGALYRGIKPNKPSTPIPGHMSTSPLPPAAPSGEKFMSQPYVSQCFTTENFRAMSENALMPMVQSGTALVSTITLGDEGTSLTLWLRLITQSGLLAAVAASLLSFVKDESKFTNPESATREVILALTYLSLVISIFATIISVTLSVRHPECADLHHEVGLYIHDDAL